jgi:WD repeat-containing protein 42A
MPLVGMDNVIISCARDSQVRLTELDSTGEVGSSRKLAQHRGPVHKIAINPETPHVALSCGEDACIFSCDIRESKPQKLVITN